MRPPADDERHGDEEDLDLRRQPVDQRQRQIGHQRVDHIGRSDPEREAERFAERVGDLLERQTGVEVGPDRNDVVRSDEPAQQLPVQVGREQERDRGQRDQGRQRRHRLVPLDLKPERIGEAEHRRRADRQRLEREIEDPRQEPDHTANQRFDGDDPEGEDRIVAKCGAGHSFEQERRQRQGHRERDEQADLRGNLRARESGRQHQAGADAAEENEGADGRLRRQRLMRRGERSGDERRHAIVPSDLISNPRAISSCDRTARVGNMRSMIMRT